MKTEQKLWSGIVRVTTMMLLPIMIWMISVTASNAAEFSCEVNAGGPVCNRTLPNSGDTLKVFFGDRCVTTTYQVKDDSDNNIGFVDDYIQGKTYTLKPEETKDEGPTVIQPGNAYDISNISQTPKTSISVIKLECRSYEKL